MITVMGIDQSYRSTGVCVIDQYSSPENGEVYCDVAHLEIISTEPTEEKGIDDSRQRAELIGEQILRLVKIYRPMEIILEAPSFGSSGNATRSLAYLCGYLTGILHDQTVSIVPPTTLKKFATGKGTSTKEEMLAAITDSGATQKILEYKKTKGRYDVTDAYWLAMYSLHN